MTPLRNDTVTPKWHTALLYGAAFLLAMLPGISFGHEPYSGWKMPDSPTTSCCDNTDCRPVRAYVGQDGLWRAWDGNEWLVIPPRKMLPADYARDGRSHLCSHPNGTVFCFSPAEPKS